MTSIEIKQKLLWELLYKRGYHMAVTEKSMIYGIADIFALTKAGFTHEIEIKVSRADLKSELDCVDLVCSGKKQEKPMSKFHKHLAYLKQDARASKYSLFDPAREPNPRVVYGFQSDIAIEKTDLPNKFSFAVPTELVEYAQEKLKDTPYGVFAISPAGTIFQVKEAKHIHKEKITQKEIMYLLRMQLQQEILNKKVKINRLENELNQEKFQLSMLEMRMRDL